MKVLIAEDDKVSRRVITSMLETFGPCDVAEDGHLAVVAFEEATKVGKPYDLICLDINMPRLSGVDVLKKIRELEEQAGIGGLDGVKIIMTTCLHDKEHVLGSFKAGCEAYIVKPIDKNKLIKSIKDLGFKEIRK